MLLTLYPLCIITMMKQLHILIIFDFYLFLCICGCNCVCVCVCVYLCVLSCETILHNVMRFYLKINYVLCIFEALSLSR